jgi:uncharacterized damage-inducible protein DinB
MSHPEQGDTSLITTFFHQNAWANLKLLEFCEGLTEEQLDATAVGGYGSIRDTLFHTIRAEVSYVERVNGRLPPEPPRRGQFPGFAVLKQAARWAEDELRQWALSARADTLVREQEGHQVAQYRLTDLMVQAITHSCEHRTQVATILTQLGLEPPDTSGWRYMEEMGRLGEFAEPARPQ